ncbi:MAG: MFS transporter, partial [Pseudomonadota bacterium]
ETPLQSAPFSELLRTQWRTIALSTFLPVASYALFHMVTVFPLSYTLLFTDYSMDRIILYELAGGVLACGAVVLSGVLADRYTKRTVLRASVALIPVLCLTIYTLDSYPWIYIIFGFIVLGLAYGQSSSIVPKRFPAEFRYSGSALSVNLSWIFGAAFAPLCGMFLAAHVGLWASALYLLSGAVVTWITLRILDRQLSDDAG